MLVTGPPEFSAVTTWLRARLLSIGNEQVQCDRRGFSTDSDAMRRRLEGIGHTFVEGYNTALRARRLDDIPERLERVDSPMRGFGFEGAAMALAILDFVLPQRPTRIDRFLTGPGRAHIYMVHVGAGWALARLRRHAGSTLARHDPVLGWLLLDGYGFHEGYFNWRKYVGRKHPPPRRLRGYERRAFDQGLGRSLWFVAGGNVERLSLFVRGLDRSRHSDLWSGIGLAAAYAGGADHASLVHLRAAAGTHGPALAQGAAFAAKARQRAGNSAPHTLEACLTLCNMPPDDAAQLTDWALEAARPTTSEPRYEQWRRLVRGHFNTQEVRA